MTLHELYTELEDLVYIQNKGNHEVLVYNEDGDRVPITSVTVLDDRDVIKLD